jgi:hypothetical protein
MMSHHLDELVPNYVQMDPWLIFHGTSNIYDEKISVRGLVPGESPFCIEDLQQVAEIYERLRWAGCHTGGYAALKPFSLGHDFANEKGKPLYLAESALRASLYASKDFAGGEICRALDYCLKDLDLYLSDEQIREEHAEELEARPGISYVPRSSIASPESVMSKVKDLSNLKSQVRAIRQSYQYGLIYALRIDKNNLSDFELFGGMGIKCFRTIANDEIEAVYKLPGNFEWVSRMDEKRSQAILEPGICRVIQNHKLWLKR